MIITEISDFLPYFEKVRGRTLRAARAVPEDRLDWQPGEGRFSTADLLRHIAGTERWMWAENAHGRTSRYKGHGADLQDPGEDVWAYVDRHHSEAVTLFESLDTQALQTKCPTVGGVEITVWKWLRAMVEHEIHHRGQIYSILGQLGAAAPPLYGLTEHQVWERSQPLG